MWDFLSLHIEVETGISQMIVAFFSFVFLFCSPCHPPTVMYLVRVTLLELSNAPSELQWGPRTSGAS